LKTINFKVPDPFYERMLRAKAEGHFLKISELIRAGVTLQLEKLKI